ncbi:MAG: DHHA1 domain-containing protein [Clostridia bacterium]|jgi:phosphoesterase RecJ-like protein|nr:DHHA1 domain-containing protein [Clostridia bacterium]
MSHWNDIYVKLAGNKQVVILVHEKADGDALGSALALALALQDLQHTPEIWYPEEAPAQYHFLPGMEMLRQIPPGPLPANVPVIAVDCADHKRIVYQPFSGSPLINLDHHVSNDYFGTLNIIDTAAAAVGELICRIFTEGGVRISPAMATCLYVAISADTGSFTYSNTTAATFRAAADLLALGADINLVRENLHEKKPYRELLIYQAGLANLVFSPDRKIVGCLLDYATLKTKDILGADTDTLIAMLRATEGVEAAFLLKETAPGTIKGSLRSKSYLDVNIIAQAFNGGGHPRASGFTLNGEIHDLKEKLMQKIAKNLTGGERR